MTVQDKLRTELVEFERSSGRTPVYEDLMSVSTFPYLDAVIRELSRTKPVLMAITRGVSS